jgi:UDP-N-acetylmuramyl pentapeptide phosphotransferase/UDP-N-acetylglucosamine-1-phosphate transferase
LNSGIGAQLLSALVIGGLTSLLLTWWMTRGAWRLPQDKPNDRSLHENPKPRSGGIAIVAGVALGSVLELREMSLMLGLALMLAIVSFVDDWRELPAVARLAAHLAAAAAFAFAGLSVEGYAAAAFVVLAIAWMTNLYNFMDGSDGLAGGMAVFGFGTYAIAASHAGDAALAALSACTAAAAAGFLAFNFPPARIFMGDVGSIPLGFLAAATGAWGWHQGVWPAWFPFLVFAPFVVDASVTLARRVWRRERVWEAHRDHYYQRLVRMGWGHRKTAIAEYALMAASASLACAAIGAPRPLQVAVVGAAAVAYAALIASVERAWRKFNAGVRNEA